MADYEQMVRRNLIIGKANEGEQRNNVGNPNQRLVWRNGAWEDAGAAPSTTTPVTPVGQGAMAKPTVKYGVSLQDVLGPGRAVPSAQTTRQSILDMADAGAKATPTARPDALPGVLTPGAINPGLDAGGRVIDERGGMGGPSAMAPTLSVNSGGQATAAAGTEGVKPAPLVPKLPPRGDLPVAIQAAKDYTPGAMAKVPGFKNYYATETQPFDAGYEAAQRANVINNAEQQYKVGADRVRSLLASRGLMSGGGTGLEGSMMGQLAMQAAGARTQGLNQLALDTAQKRADYNMRRAEGLMSAQRDQFGRYVDEQKLPLLLDEQKARVKSMLLQNGVDQYAAERLMEMDMNEWPDLLKNILKGGMIAGGIYTGNPALITAGVGYR